MYVRNLTLLAVPAMVALAVGGGVAPAFARSSTVIIAPGAPPPPRVETIPPPNAPPQMMTWEAGHWAWNGTNWDWTGPLRAAPAADRGMGARPLGAGIHRRLYLGRWPLAELSRTA